MLHPALPGTGPTYVRRCTISMSFLELPKCKNDDKVSCQYETYYFLVVFNF